MNIPHTPAAFTHITDADYRPLPWEKDMDWEREIDRAVEFSRARDVDALVDGNGDAEWQRESLSLTPDAWLSDAADFLLNLSDEDMGKLRQKLKDLIWWERYMLKGASGPRLIDFAGQAASISMDIAALLMKSLEKSEITIEHLGVE